MQVLKRLPKSAEQGDAYCLRDSHVSDLKKVLDRQTHSWTDLPDTVLRNIFMRLPDVDRASMARACKTWNYCFHDDELWRSRAFDFGPKPEFKHQFEEIISEDFGVKFINGQKAIKFAMQFATSLEKMYIMFQKMSQRNRNSVIRDFTTFLTCFDKANLTTLYVSRLKLYKFKSQQRQSLVGSLLRLMTNQWTLQEHQDQILIDSLISFISNQRNLQTVLLASIYLDIENGLKVLQALSDGSGSTITNLYLRGFFEKGIPVHREPRVVTEMKQVGRDVVCRCSTFKPILEMLDRQEPLD